MKKYIIVSIIVAALFVGGSIAVVKAQVATQSAKTYTTDVFAGNVATALIQKGASSLSQTELTTLITGIIRIMPSEGGFAPVSAKTKTFKPVLLPIAQQQGGGLATSVYVTVWNMDGSFYGCGVCDSVNPPVGCLVAQAASISSCPGH